MEDEKIINKLIRNYNLLCSIISQPPDNTGSGEEFVQIEKIIQQDIPDMLKQNAPENFYELYMDFKAEYARFKDFILYDKLIGKKIIALGGGFSSGKSTFLNFLMAKEHGQGKKAVLPENTNPSTSVPTYIVNGSENDILGVNVFDAKVPIPLSYIGKIAHGFGRIKKDREEDLTDAVTLGHVLENMFFSTPWQKYKNIAFLDTPGYSNPDSQQYSARTDEKIARSQLNASDYILWFVMVESGTITKADIQFIQSLRQDIPKLIIISKADAKPLEDIKAVIEKVKQDLSGSGIRYENVLAFSDCLKHPLQEGERKAFIENQIKCMERQIETWDNRIYESNFARNFKTLFVRCKTYYDQEIEEEERRLGRLNTAATKLGAADVDADVLEPLQLLVKEAQQNLKGLKLVKGQLDQLQNDFFLEIKRIADVVGILMPEPEEIAVMRDQAEDAWDILRKCTKHSNGNRMLSDRIKELFADVRLVITEQPGGVKYKQKLLDGMRAEGGHLSRRSDFYRLKSVYEDTLKKSAAGKRCVVGAGRLKQYQEGLKI